MYLAREEFHKKVPSGRFIRVNLRLNWAVQKLLQPVLRISRMFHDVRRRVIFGIHDLHVLNRLYND